MTDTRYPVCPVDHFKMRADTQCSECLYVIPRHSPIDPSMHTRQATPEEDRRWCPDDIEPELDQRFLHLGGRSAMFPHIGVHTADEIYALLRLWFIQGVRASRGASQGRIPSDKIILSKVEPLITQKNIDPRKLGGLALRAGLNWARNQRRARKERSIAKKRAR